MNVQRPLFILAFVLALILPALPAAAVIAIAMPVSRVYATSTQVIYAQIASINAEKSVIVATPVEVFKGEPAEDRIRLQVVEPRAVIQQASEGQPLLIFVGGRSILMHLADTWLVAQRDVSATPPLLRIVQEYDLKKSFPGSTPALLRIVREIRAGKPGLINAIENKVFQGGVRQIAALPVRRPAYILAADVSGDGRPDLLVGTEQGARLFISAGADYHDATAARGLRDAHGAQAAAADVNGDGRIDLLIGHTLWLNDGERFAQSRSPVDLQGPCLAVAFIDLTGDGRPDLASLRHGGELLVHENPGSAERRWISHPPKLLWPADQAAATDRPLAASFGPWGEDDEPCVLVARATGLVRYSLNGDPRPVDFTRLTGEQLGAHHKEHRNGFDNLAATPIDIDGNGLLDYLLVADGAAVMLVNRGFGAYLINPDALVSMSAAAGGQLPFSIDSSTVWTSADLKADRFEDLLVLSEDGTLYAVDNAPVAVQP